MQGQETYSMSVILCRTDCQPRACQVAWGYTTRLPTQETQEVQVQPLGWKDLLEEEMTTHSSILFWEIL